MTPIAASDTCVLVAEITGDNALLEKIGHVETLRAVERSRKRAERSVDAYEGSTISANDRRLVAHFPKEDNAVIAALDMLVRVKQLPPVSGVALSIHIVVHRCALNESGNGPDAGGLELACQLLPASPPNQLLVSSEAAAGLSEGLHSQIMVERTSEASIGYPSPLYAFPSGASAGSPGSGIASHAAIDSFAPSSTSVSTDQHGFTDAQAQHDNAAPDDNGGKLPDNRVLLLRYRNLRVSVSGSQSFVLAGREEGNDLLILDPRASRHHARIALREQGFVLIDTSTNGTFMVDNQAQETVLRRSEAPMPERGKIGLGFSPLEIGTDPIYFEIG
jgi:adenylate cyclase